MLDGGTILFLANCIHLLPIRTNYKLLSSEGISLTHCIVKWCGGPSSKNWVTWPRFVTEASAFCLVSSQKWSVLFSMFDLSPLHHVLNWQVFLHWYYVLHYLFNEKSAQRDANTARALAVVKFGHRPPARCKHKNAQTGPITIHCAAAS